MKNKGRKTSVQQTETEKAKNSIASAENVSDEELFLKDIFDSEEKLDIKRDVLGCTEDYNRNGTFSAENVREDDVATGDLLSTEEIDAFFDEIKSQTEEDVAQILPDTDVFEEQNSPLWLEKAKIDAADVSERFETLSDSTVENGDEADKASSESNIPHEDDILTDIETSCANAANVPSKCKANKRSRKKRNESCKVPHEKKNALCPEVADEVKCEEDDVPTVATDSLSETHEAEPTVCEEVSTDKTELDRSLDGFTYEDAGSKFPKHSKKTDIFRIGMLLVCLFVFSYSVRYLINNIYEKYKSDSVYNEINSGIEFNIPGSVAEDGIVALLTPDNVGAATPTMDDIIKNGVSQTVTSSHSAELAKVRASLEHLKNINSDLYGYILVPGTNISYPIAQHESDNDYYLDRAYNGEHLVNGSIFADVRCDDDVMMNYNTVLYGHNVTSGSMFNHVSMFFDRDFFENTLIYIYTYDGIFVYKPFSIHETEYDSGYITTAFATVEDFIDFADEMRELSDIESSAEFTAESRVLTLSTCTNGIYSRRYALHAYLVERITD